VRRAAPAALLVRIGETDFYGRVRHKFRLADAPELGGGDE
jgi:hypothetical protein